jgi:hypothetical protein
MRIIRWFVLFLICSIGLQFTPFHAQALAATVTLHWTAPGDDGSIGRAAKYDLRYSLIPITPATFALATRVSGTPVPQAAGKTDSMKVTGMLAGGPFYFALKSADEANNWSAISNVVIRSSTMLGVEDELSSLSLSAPWPNPASHSTRFDFTLPQAMVVVASAFDLSGRRVRTIASEVRPAGRGTLVWDLRDDAGRKAQPGVYFVHTWIAEQHWTHRLAIVS